MKRKLPTIRVQQKRSVTVPMLAFFPNPRGGKNCAYVVVANDESIEKNNQLIRTDETGSFLYINEMALPMSTRLELHKQSRLMKDKPLIYDERAKNVRFVWSS